MKEEWLFPNAIVPVNVETTSELVAEIKRLIDVIGGMVLAQPYIAVSNDRMNVDPHTGNVGIGTVAQRTWVGLTDEKIQAIAKQARSKDHAVTLTGRLLKEKNFD